MVSSNQQAAIGEGKTYIARGTVSPPSTALQVRHTTHTILTLEPTPLLTLCPLPPHTTLCPHYPLHACAHSTDRPIHLTSTTPTAHNRRGAPHAAPSRPARSRGADAAAFTPSVSYGCHFKRLGGGSLRPVRPPPRLGRHRLTSSYPIWSYPIGTVSPHPIQFNPLCSLPSNPIQPALFAPSSPFSRCFNSICSDLIHFEPTPLR